MSIEQDLSPGLEDLLASMREHPAFPDLLALIDSSAPGIKPYAPGHNTADLQTATWIFNSGRQVQILHLKELLTRYQAQRGDQYERRTATRG